MREHKRVQIFENPLLEKLTMVHPAGPFVFWFPVVCILMWYSLENMALTGGEYALVCGAGILAWTFVEYALHRWLFHFVSQNESTARMIYVVHGNHHDDPYDKLRGVMPLAPAIIYAGLLYIAFTALLGFKYGNPFFAAFLAGYLAYDYIHYGTHHFKARTPIGKYLRKFHLTHHVHDDARFGVSSPLWDILLGTYNIEKKRHDK